MRISDKIIDHVYVERFTRDRSFRMPEYHYHPYYELYYVDHGTVSVFIRSETYQLSTGDLLIIPPRLLHFMRYFGQMPVVRTNIFFQESDLDPDVKHALHFSSDYQDLVLYQVPVHLREELDSHLSSLLLEDKKKDSISNTMLRIRTNEILLLLHRYGQRLDSLSGKLHTTDSAIIAAAGYISQHFADSISLSDIAEHAGLSPNYLSTKFREVTGLGVHDYLTFVRLEAAAKQLLLTNQKITEIALSTGFNSSNYFKDAFKKMYGVSPREYRTKLSNALSSDL